jgi:peptide/nickel transport system substrate-binding protein
MERIEISPLRKASGAGISRILEGESMKKAHRWLDGQPWMLARRDFLKVGAASGIGFAALSMVGPGSCKALAQGSQPKSGGTLVVRSGPIRGIDPHFETWATTLQVVHQAYNALVKFNHDGTKIVPDLAESWEQKDELTYVFRLRQGVRFHDVPPVSGRELTSADVKYSIERQMTDQPGKFQHAYFFLGKLASIDTPDKYTVVFKTPEPYAPFMNYMASPWTVIVAREVVEKYGDLQRHAIGTGPFIMQEYRRDQEAVFVKNPHYFKKGLPYLDEVRIQYVIDPAAATAAFRGQQTDISNLEFADIDSIKASDPGIHVAEILSMFPVVMRTQPYDAQRPLKPPFTEKKVRQAIQAAVKPEEFIQISRSGWGVPMVGPIPPNRKPWALPESARPEHDPKKAKQLLAEAGYANGFEVELIVGAPHDNVKNAQIVKDQLARIDITVHVKTMEMAQYYNKTYAYDYAMSVHTMLSGEEPEESLRPYFGANATYYRWGNTAVHRLVDEQAKVLDQRQRVEMIHTIQRMILEDAPNMFLYTSIYHIGVQPWVKNYTVPVNLYDQRYEEIWIARQRQ